MILHVTDTNSYIYLNVILIWFAFFYKQIVDFVITWIALLKYEGLISKSDAIHTDIQTNIK